MSSYLIDIEDAVIAKIQAATRVNPSNATVPFFNRVDIFRGEKAEIFMAVARETAPSCWLRLDRALNAVEEFKQAMGIGQVQTVGTARNNAAFVWSFFLCARSLRATRELSQGGINVVGAYDMVNVLVGPPGSPSTTPGQIRGFKPTTVAEPFVLVGFELLGQTTTEAVYELQFRTRVQLT